MILEAFTNVLIKTASFVALSFNNIVRNIKQILLNSFSSQEKLRVSYIERSFGNIENLRFKDDWLNIHNDYKRIGKDFRKVINEYERP